MSAMAPPSEIEWSRLSPRGREIVRQIALRLTVRTTHIGMIVFGVALVMVAVAWPGMQVSIPSRKRKRHRGGPLLRCCVDPVGAYFRSKLAWPTVVPPIWISTL